MKIRLVIKSLALILISGIFVIVFSFPLMASGQQNVQKVLADPPVNKVFVPLISKPSEVFLGVYTKGYIGDQNIINSEVKNLDLWAAATGGKPLSILGTFISIEQPTTLVTQLEVPWKNGYVVFVNMGSTHTADELANGSMDKQIRKWADYYKIWTSKGGGRWAMLAPLQEMNGFWTPYSRNPTVFKQAYRHIQTLFKEEGIADNSVRWVFAPNGYQNPEDPPFEDYYPGDQYVSIISFSSYNFGLCPAAIKVYLDPQWQTAETIFSDYLARMKKMAPGKPIFIAETGTTSYTQKNHPDQSAKNQWLIDTYKYLVQEDVRGIIYFNLDLECDFAFYQPTGRKLNGYGQAASLPEFRYLNPVDLITVFR
jgi:hypothetical protein